MSFCIPKDAPPVGKGLLIGFYCLFCVPSYLLDEKGRKNESHDNWNNGYFQKPFDKLITTRQLFRLNLSSYSLDIKSCTFPSICDQRTPRDL